MHASLPPPFLRVVQGGWPARGCPFKSASGRLPSPGEPAAAQTSKPQPQPDPLAEGAGQPRREAASGSPFHPAGPLSPNLQENPRVYAGLSCLGRQGLGGLKAAPLGCVTSGQSLPFSVPWLPSSLPRKPWLRAFLEKGASWEGHSGRFSVWIPEIGAESQGSPWVPAQPPPIPMEGSLRDCSVSKRLHPRPLCRVTHCPTCGPQLLRSLRGWTLNVLRSY